MSVGVNLKNVNPSIGLFVLFNGSYVSGEKIPYVYNQTNDNLMFRSLNVSYSGEWSVHVSSSHGSATADFILNITGETMDPFIEDILYLLFVLDCSKRSRGSGVIIFKMDFSICLLILLWYVI